LQTKDHYLYTFYDGDEAIGMIWLRAELDRPVKGGFIFGVEIKEEFRGKGYGKQIMLLSEDEARKLGIKKIVACLCL
jgi:predicted acetyltransferase